jgi:hypothetical protein
MGVGGSIMLRQRGLAVGGSKHGFFPQLRRAHEQPANQLTLLLIHAVPPERYSGSFGVEAPVHCRSAEQAAPPFD